MLFSLMRAPLSFFELTPTGRCVVVEDLAKHLTN